MKVILGLGNPGKEYEHTRHNVGWWLVDHLADRWGFDGWKKDGQAKVAQGHLPGLKEPVRLVKPLTYMNLSGGVLVQYARRPFWAPATDLMVLVDEVAIPAGTWRLRAEGGAGGHNGLKSIHVLGAVGTRDAELIRGLLPVMTEAVEAWARTGIKGALDVQSRLGKSAG